MSIRKHLTWDGSKYRGFVDVGTGEVQDDSAPVAKEALVVMAVCVNSTWKVPLGYFLVNGLTGEERANVIKICIERLCETGVEVVSVTCDGPSCHFAMLSALGASLSPANLQACFPHPLKVGKSIYIFMDVCHMLKLVRNTFAELGILVDGENGKISWRYITELQKLQDKEGLRLANKLKQDHIRWYQQKMKVNLASQTISSSVADAIEYCATHLKMPQFEGSGATVKFIRTFDRLFDILNSRNPFARGYKSINQFQQLGSCPSAVVFRMRCLRAFQKHLLQ